MESVSCGKPQRPTLGNGMSGYPTGWMVGRSVPQTSLPLGSHAARLHFVMKSRKCLKTKRNDRSPNMFGSPEEQPDLIRTNWIVALSFRIEFSFDRVLVIASTRRWR